MNNQLTLFQYILMGLFGALLVGGLIVLALIPPEPKNAEVVIVTDTVIWGPALPNGGFRSLLRKVDEGSPLAKTKYVEKDPDTFYSELVEAIATGKGPDAIIFDGSDLLPMLDKIVTLPYSETFSLLDYQNTFIDGANIFISDTGMYALPLLVDPLVLYWNKDLFRNAGLVSVPQDWESFIDTVTRITILTDDAEIAQSAVAFGEFQNVTNASEILSALLMQTGVNIVVKKGADYVSDLTARRNETNPTLALSFYSDFANPVKNVYTWNKTMDRSREAFAANKVAMYAGFASERESLDLLNPNLNYAMAVWPQSVRATVKSTYGHIYGIAVLKSPNSVSANAAYAVARALALSGDAQRLSSITGLPSAQRAFLKETPDDPYTSIAVQSARIAKTWLHPDSLQVDAMFERAIESILAGNSIDRTLVTLHEDINVGLKNYVRD